MSTRWRAPGRVNLIGEHTDYNAGFALPFAIAQGCVATVDPAGGRELVVTSVQRPGAVRFALEELSPGDGGWAGYVAGVVFALQNLGVDVPGLQIAVDSSVPSGGGLSSSAALTCAVATAVDDLLELALSPAQLLAATRSAETEFVGAPTGGMDQLASLRCTAEHALFCDMASLATEQVPLDLPGAGLALLVVDTRAPHRHADGEYRLRREACERAAKTLGVPVLREIGMADLATALPKLPDDRLRRYARHIVTENDRVLTTVALLRAGRPEDIGPLLTASHESLRDDYRVSVPELDVAVEAALAAGALGARMTGGGFGGSVIALLPVDGVQDTVEAVRAAFARHGFGRPETFTCRPCRGAHRIAD